MARKIHLTEAQFVSMFTNKPTTSNDEPFYQDGDFKVSKERMEKARGLFHPYYRDRYKGDKERIIHQIAFARTMRMIDNGQLKPIPNNAHGYWSLRNRKFSSEQVANVEASIRHEFEGMSLEELYDYLIIDRERDSHERDKMATNAVMKLLNDGFFDDFLNGQAKELALWSIGRQQDVNGMLSRLYAKNRFTRKPNILVIKNEIEKTKEHIADTNDDFMFDDTALAMDKLLTAIAKLDRIPSKKG